MPQLVGNSLALTGLRWPGAGGGAGGCGPPVSYPVNAVNFDGTNDNLTTNAALTGTSDGTDILVSLWFNIAGGNGNQMDIFTDVNNRIVVTRIGDGRLDFRLSNSVPTILFRRLTVADYDDTVNSGWNHLLVAASLVATPVAQFYVNDVAVATTDATAPTAGNIDWTTTDYGFGSNATDGNRFNGDFAEVYVTDEYLDLDIKSNRCKFINDDLKPVNLGSDGSTPTGTAALVLFSGATATWHTNDGSGGGFTEVGEITDGSTSPSD